MSATKPSASKWVFATTALAGVVWGAGSASATTVSTLALPGGATNQFAGGFFNGASGEWPILNQSGLTDGIAYDSTANPQGNSEAFSPTATIYADVFDTPTADVTTSASSVSQTTSTVINTIRLYGVVSGGSPTDSLADAYILPPNAFSFYYDYTNGNPTNPGGVSDTSHWGYEGTVLAVNGVPVADPTAGDTALITSAEWAENGVVPGTAGPGGDGVYYVDITVADDTGLSPVPQTNSLEFSLGEDNQPGGYGGFGLNEIQAYDAPAVPEPASLSLLAIGTFGLLGRRRRRPV